jgi:AraC family transcriptional activator of pobA
VNRCLNEAIIRQLINTGNPLKQIAAELGFADEQYFNRFFTKMNGVPPARYRQRLLSGY